MDVGGFEVVGFKFSSVCVMLTASSRQSQLEFFEKCTKNPEFLQNWLNQLLKSEHIEAMQKANITEMDFDICIRWPSKESGTLLNTVELHLGPH